MKLDVSDSGDTIVIPAKDNQIPVITELFLVCMGEETIQWKSGSTELTGSITSPSSGWGYESKVALRGEKGESIILTLGGSMQVSGAFEYEYLYR